MTSLLLSDYCWWALWEKCFQMGEKHKKAKAFLKDFETFSALPTMQLTSKGFNWISRGVLHHLLRALQSTSWHRLLKEPPAACLLCLPSHQRWLGSSQTNTMIIVPHSISYCLQPGDSEEKTHQATGEHSACRDIRKDTKKELKLILWHLSSMPIISMAECSHLPTPDYRN